MHPFKKPEHIPYALIRALAAKMTHEEWITIYESSKQVTCFFLPGKHKQLCFHCFRNVKIEAMLYS